MSEILNFKDPQFLIRVLKNEINEEEIKEFNKWLAEKDERKEEFGQIALLWEKLGNLPTPLSPDLDAEWNKLISRINAHEKTPQPRIRSKISSFKPNQNSSTTIKYFSNYFKKYVILSRVAALILISILAYKILSQSPINQSKEIEEKEIKQFEFITKKGEKATIPLSDGTIVYLNADSKLIYPQYFDESKRFLRLEGEGYFAVKEDKQRPFIVQTGDKFTQVKGTEFNIKFRKNKLSVVVTKGRVRLFSQDSTKFVELVKGELSVATERGFTSPIKVDTRLYTAWRENKLSFVGNPFLEIIEEIERFYNVDIVCKNKKILTKTLTGYFDSNSLDEILSKISLALDFKFQRNGRIIIVY